jgi:transposase
MQNVRFIGLDVHKDSIVIAVADNDGSQPEVVCTIPNETNLLLKQLKKLGAPSSLRVCYEAGPTGFGLYRALREAKIDCQVVAPSLIPKRAGDRVKTDKRDARNLARFLRSGDLTPIHVPDAATEAMRDLERAREDAKDAERAARHHLTKFLLRNGRKFAGKTTWTRAHLDWIRSQTFEHEAHNRVLVDYVHAVDNATARVEQLTKDIAELVETWSLKPLVHALQSLRGVQLITAVVLVAEIGNFSRFASAPELMAYLGLIPSENSSGESERRGGITRAGNRHARRVLVESAWSYRYRANMSAAIRKRNRGLAEGVQQTAWKAQCRLHSRYQRMAARGKPHQVVVTAVARELAGFVWSIARQSAPQES